MGDLDLGFALVRRGGNKYRKREGTSSAKSLLVFFAYCWKTSAQCRLPLHHSEVWS